MQRLKEADLLHPKTSAAEGRKERTKHETKETEKLEGTTRSLLGRRCDGAVFDFHYSAFRQQLAGIQLLSEMPEKLGK